MLSVPAGIGMFGLVGGSGSRAAVSTVGVRACYGTETQWNRVRN